VHLVDDRGQELVADYYGEPDGGHAAVILNSRSGRSGGKPARNKDYGPALNVLLSRLGRLDAVLVDALVDSSDTQQQGLAEADRRIIEPPIRLALVPDVNALRLEMGRKQARVGRASRASRGGGGVKRIRLLVDVPGYQPTDAGRLAEILAAPIAEADPKLLRTLPNRDDNRTPRRARLRRTPVPVPSAPAAASLGIGNRAGRHPDYGLLDEENSRRGKQGEELVLHYERDWLREHGRSDLADAVRWIAREDGDGLGYDVLSFNLDARERYIEVKATALGERTPFYISSAELDFAQRHPDRYVLYRVYDLDGEPRFFALEGDITEVLGLSPVIYSARLATTVPDGKPN
jgi:hypothetical protein